MQELCSFQNAIFTLLQGRFSSCHKQVFSFFYSRTFSNVRANQTQHDRSLGGRKNTAQGAEKKSGLILHIHVVGRFNDCRLQELWAAARKKIGWQETAENKKCAFNCFLSLTMSKCQGHRPTMAKALCAHNDSQNPNSLVLPSSSSFSLSADLGRKSFLCEVVLSRMANTHTQSSLHAGKGSLQHFRHLFQFTTCLTSARRILLTQVYVSWTEIAPLPRHNETLPPHATPTETWERVGRKEFEKKEEIKHNTGCLYFLWVCVKILFRKLPQLGQRELQASLLSSSLSVSVFLAASLPASLH